MSSGWVRCSVCVAPLPFGWKLCFSVSPRAICLTVSVLLEAPEVAPVLGAVELELEHPAVPSRPAATTVAPSRVAVCRLDMFTKPLVCDPGDARRSGVEGADERPMTRGGPNSTHLVNAVRYHRSPRGQIEPAPTGGSYFFLRRLPKAAGMFPGGVAPGSWGRAAGPPRKPANPSPLPSPAGPPAAWASRSISASSSIEVGALAAAAGASAPPASRPFPAPAPAPP